ncbi:hypothetical protein B0H17DRAFT_1299597 [Mycena rosella]|uniref:Uncharacterized protein n=1 Tax=Mycena rosella TaxID=1033263 RepID=A0AAD7GCK3_MYCRO|nr:hypothetical protein B0H17DRAFT_1299597 [Mycena rosella]
MPLPVDRALVREWDAPRARVESRDDPMGDSTSSVRFFVRARLCLGCAVWDSGEKDLRPVRQGRNQGGTMPIDEAREGPLIRTTTVVDLPTLLGRPDGAAIPRRELEDARMLDTTGRGLATPVDRIIYAPPAFPALATFPVPRALPAMPPLIAPPNPPAQAPHARRHPSRHRPAEPQAPAALLPLFRTCHALHAQLRFGGNPTLWGQIGRAKFARALVGGAAGGAGRVAHGAAAAARDDEWGGKRRTAAFPFCSRSSLPSVVPCARCDVNARLAARRRSVCVRSPPCARPAVHTRYTVTAPPRRRWTARPGRGAPSAVSVPASGSVHLHAVSPAPPAAVTLHFRQRVLSSTPGQQKMGTSIREDACWMQKLTAASARSNFLDQSSRSPLVITSD